jgi:hypothetical protein
VKINLQMYWQNHLAIIHSSNIGNKSMDGKQCIQLGTYMLQAICERECWNIKTVMSINTYPYSPSSYLSWLQS